MGIHVSKRIVWLVLAALVAFAGAGAIGTWSSVRAAVHNHPSWWVRFAFFNAAAYLPLVWAIASRKTGKQHVLSGLLAWFGGCLVGLLGALVALAVINPLAPILVSPRSVGSLIGSGLYLVPGATLSLLTLARHKPSPQQP